MYSNSNFFLFVHSTFLWVILIFLLKVNFHLFHCWLSIPAINLLQLTFLPDHYLGFIRYSMIGSEQMLVIANIFEFLDFSDQSIYWEAFFYSTQYLFVKSFLTLRMSGCLDSFEVTISFIAGLIILVHINFIGYKPFSQVISKSNFHIFSSNLLSNLF